MDTTPEERAAYELAGSRMRELVVHEEFFSVNRKSADRIRNKLLGIKLRGLTCVSTLAYTDEENQDSLVLVASYMGLRKARKRKR